MITRFRIEGWHKTQQDMVDQLTLTACEIMRNASDQEGEWECTQDVTEKTKLGYKGRMVFKFHEEPRRIEEDE